MNRGTIWLDVDGVLFDYTTAFLRFSGLNKQGYKYENIFDYNLGKLFPGGLEECRKVMFEFTKSEDFKWLPCLAFRLDLEMLYNMGFKLKVITTLPTETQIKINRIRELTSHFGPVFSDMIFTDWKDCKLEYIVNQPDFYTGRHILVEDNPVLLKKVDEYLKMKVQAHGRESNLQCYAVAHPYNEKELGLLDALVICPNFAIVTQMIATGELSV